VLYCVHANKETIKNSHLSTQENSNFSAQESSGFVGNVVSLKKGDIKSAHIDGQKQAREKEA
jgi:hypothetical protein